jgi:cyclopropane fatty-acyl-phospholipid synthase-like methyltransferase
MEKEIIRSFWTAKARTGQSRWAKTNFVEYELEVLLNLNPQCKKILDLGCGNGELSRQLCDSVAALHAVDMEPDFGKFFGGPNHCFEVCDVTEFRSAKTFDLILLFGVVTYLTLEEEHQVYSNIALMKKDSGVAVIKNQCSVDEEFIVDGFSEELGCRYVGRYPSIAEQFTRLQAHFEVVEIHKYPPDFKVHKTSEFVMFECR